MHKGEGEDVFVLDCCGTLQLGHTMLLTIQIPALSSDNFPGGHWFLHTNFLSFSLISKYCPLAHVKYS